MKQKLSAILSFYKGLSVFDRIRVALMTLIGLVGMSLPEPLEDLFRILFDGIYPTIYREGNAQLIATLLLVAVEAALFGLLSKNFSLWLRSLAVQVFLVLIPLVYGIVIGGFLGIAVMGYFILIPVGKSLLVQLVAVGGKELLYRKIGKRACPIVYGICALLAIASFIRLFTLPTVKQLGDELNEVLRESELIDLSWSYFGENEMERIPDAEWKAILPNIQVDTDRQIEFRHTDFALSMGYYSDSHEPFGPFVDLYWFEEEGYFQIDYRGACFYADDSAFVELIEPYMTYSQADRP